MKMKLSSIGTRILCNVLRENYTLHSLDLSRNALNDQAGNKIAHLLHTNTCISTLNLGSNAFGPETVSSFAKALEKNCTLKYLNLENEIFEFSGALLEIPPRPLQQGKTHLQQGCWSSAAKTPGQRKPCK